MHGPFCLLATSGVVLVGPEIVSVAEDFVRGLYVAWPITMKAFSLQSFKKAWSRAC
jgi:hypothetical protein